MPELKQSTCTAIIDTLDAYAEHINDDCGRTGCMCDLRGDLCSQWVTDLIDVIKNEIHGR